MSVPVSLRTTGAPPPRSACWAPWVHLFLMPNGDVLPCCLNMGGMVQGTRAETSSGPLGNVQHSSLRDIWQGARMDELRRALAADDFSKGCQTCASYAAGEGRVGPISPDDYVELGRKQRDDPIDWPRSIQFNLSNACNLQCVQCSGDFSSAIRAKREGRAPMASPYGDEFFEELADFVPHLEVVSFSGGEPFLAQENYRALDLIADLAPHLQPIITTNATQWTPRVRRVLDQLDVVINVSLDGITKATFESIRVDADFDVVMRNTDRFRDYSQRVGTHMQINHCLMVQNHHELGALLLWAESLDLPVEVQIVRNPGSCSISHLPAAELEAVRASLHEQAAELGDRVPRNRAELDAVLRRVDRWADEATAGRSNSAKVLSFPRRGAAATDLDAVVAELAPTSVDGRVHVMTVGPDDAIRTASPDIAEIVGVDAAQLVGTPVQDLMAHLTARWGTALDTEVLDTGDDRTDLQIPCRTALVRCTMLPLRDADGWAEAGALLLTRCEPGPGSGALHVDQADRTRR